MQSSFFTSSSTQSLPKPDFLKWLVREDEVVIEGTNVECFRIEGQIDEASLQDWALHIRRHYIRDDELANYTRYYNQDAESYLTNFKIPDIAQIRGGDFAEIIISDLLQFIDGYTVPRYKQHGREDKNNSGRGTDVIAYKVKDPQKPSSEDELVAIEVKSRSASTDLKGAICEASRDSLKDRSRLAMSLCYYAEKSLHQGDLKTSEEMRRFLDAAEHPFIEKFAIGAVAGIEDAKAHLEKHSLELVINTGDSLFIIHRPHLMELIHNIYDRCVS